MNWRYILVCFVLLTACGTQEQSAATNTDVNQAAATEQVQVVTTMSVLADMIEQVGGEHVDVKAIIPRGAGPEEYQATPGDAQTISNAQIVFFNGHDLEAWIEPLFENAAPTQPRIELSAAMQALDSDEEHSEEAAHSEEEEHTDEEHSEEAEHAHAEGNPHFWLDPTYVISYTMIIRDELSQLDPVHAEAYAANAQAYIDQLLQLDQELQALAATLPAEQRKLVTNHDAFPYFAQRYGFDIVGIVLENPEGELSAGELHKLIETIGHHEIKAIFSESQFNARTAELLATEAGIETISLLYSDTLGTDEATSYLELMRYNMNTIIEALN